MHAVEHIALIAIQLAAARLREDIRHTERMRDTAVCVGYRVAYIGEHIGACRKIGKLRDGYFVVKAFCKHDIDDSRLRQALHALYAVTAK